MSKYIEFQQVMNFKGKTKRYDIVSKSSGDIIGRISWYSQWRQYTFAPGYPTVWNKDCLQTIYNFLDELMFQRRIERNPKLIEKIKNQPNYINFDGEDKQ